MIEGTILQKRPMNRPGLLTLVTAVILLFPTLSTTDRLSNLGTTQPRKPVITLSPTDTFSEIGILEFKCRAEGRPKPAISWHNATDGTLLVDQVPSTGSTTGFHINQHYGALMISNPKKGVAYSVYCNASNSAGWTVSQPPVRGGLAFLDQTFIRLPASKTVHSGDRVVFDCHPPSSLPPADVVWLKNSKPIDVDRDTSQLRMWPGTHSLELFAAQPDDSGSYVCRAVNAAGSVETPPAVLTVVSRTQFIETPVDVKVRRGQSAEFRCRVADSRHLVEWRKENGHVDSRRAELTGDGRLILHDVQPSDAGRYVCAAPGGISAGATLTIETPPAFIQTPDDLTIKQGDTAVFNCYATGYPQPSIYWELPDKTPIFPDEASANDRFYLHPDGRLEIYNVQLGDSGKYQCAAHSSIDRIHSSASLTVLPAGSPLLSPEVNVPSLPVYKLAPIVGLPPANQSRAVGKLVTLDCELSMQRPVSAASGQASVGTTAITGASEWRTTWFFAPIGSLQPIQVADSISGPTSDNYRHYSLFPGGSLQILESQPHDSGDYSCIVSSVNNPRFQSNWTARLNVGSGSPHVDKNLDSDNPISPPRNLRYSNLTATSIILGWDLSDWPLLLPTDNQQLAVDQSESRVSYWVEYYRPDSPDGGWTVVSRSWPANLIEIRGLQPSTVYYFLIRPRGPSGRIGYASAPIGPIKTLRPSHAVSRLLVGDPLPLTSSGQVKRFKALRPSDISLQIVSSWRMRVSWKSHEPEASPHARVLDHLMGFVVSYRRLSLTRCLTGYDQSAAISDEYCSLQGASSSDQLIQQLKTFLPSNDSTLPFDDSPQSADVSARKPSLTFDSSPDDETYHSAMPSGSWFTLLRDLKAFSCYQVEVTPYAINSISARVDGRKSKSIITLTYEAIPASAPVKLAARWLSDTEVQLSWLPPPSTDWNGLLTGYRVYVYNERHQTHQSYNLTEPHLSLNQLLSTVTYSIKLAAVNCRGVGVRSQPLRLLSSQSHLRRSGLGAGFGFDAETGIPYDSSSDALLNNGSRLWAQPWFIATLLASLAAWTLVVGLLVYCCCCRCFACRRRDKSVKLKQTPLHSANGYPGNTPLLGHPNTDQKPAIMTNGNGIHQPVTSVYLQPLIIQPGMSSQAPPPYIGAPATYSEYAAVAHNMVNYPTMVNGVPFDSVARSQAQPAPTLVYYDTSCDGDMIHRGDIYSTASPDKLGLTTLQLSRRSEPPTTFASNGYPTPIFNSSGQPVYPTGLPLVAPVAPLCDTQTANYYPDTSTGRSSPSVTPYAIASIVHPGTDTSRRLSRYHQLDPRPSADELGNSSRSTSSRSCSDSAKSSHQSRTAFNRLARYPDAAGSIPPPPDYPPPSPMDNESPRSGRKRPSLMTSHSDSNSSSTHQSAGANQSGEFRLPAGGDEAPHQRQSSIPAPSYAQVC